LIIDHFSAITHPWLDIDDSISQMPDTM